MSRGLILDPSIVAAENTNGLVVWMPFDDGRAATDKSGNGHNGALSANLVASNEGITPTGLQPGSGLKFNGTDTDVTIIGVPAITNLTVMCWIKMASVTASHMYVMRSNVNATWELFCDNSGTPHLKIRGSSAGDSLASTSPILANVWNFCAATIDGSGNAAVQLNAEYKTGTATPIPANTNNIHIGNFDNSNFFANGTIADVRIYNRILSQAELSDIYQRGLVSLQEAEWPALFAPGSSVNLSGAGCSALAGSLAPQDSFVVGGAQASAQAGSVSVSTASSTSVNISGAQVAAQAGSVKPAISVPLAGAGAAAQAGAISETDAIGLTGAAATAAAGALAPKISVALSGAQAVAQAGAVSFSGSINAPITGAQVAASAGSVAETDTIALSGAAATAQAGQVSFSNALNVPLTGAQANTGAGSLAPAITTKALIGAAAIAQAGAVFSSINVRPLGSAAIGQAGILAETARFSLLGAAAAALAGQVTVSIGAAVLLASARLVRVAGEARIVRLSADARTVTPGAS